MSHLKRRRTLQRSDSLFAAACCSSSTLVMRQLGRFKDGGVIAGMLRPHRIDNAHPTVRERPHGHTVAFPLRPLALVVAQSPAFALGGEPSELVQRVAQGFETSIALVGFGIVATGKGHWSGSG